MSAVACTAMFVMSLPADQFCTDVLVLMSNNRISPFELEIEINTSSVKPS